MQYIIKDFEGIENFLKTYCVIEVRDIYLALDNFFDKGFIIKQGILKDGDEIIVKITEATNYSRKKIETETVFTVVQHDSFLLKLVKQ